MGCGSYKGSVKNKQPRDSNRTTPQDTSTGEHRLRWNDSNGAALSDLDGDLSVVISDTSDDGSGCPTQSGVVLPKGHWVRAVGTAYYYAARENLYYYPPTCQFYDPTNGMWYDPEKQEWYADSDVAGAAKRTPPPV